MMWVGNSGFGIPVYEDKNLPLDAVKIMPAGSVEIRDIVLVGSFEKFSERLKREGFFLGHIQNPCEAT